jgi:hypothetical protein
LEEQESNAIFRNERRPICMEGVEKATAAMGKARV